MNIIMHIDVNNAFLSWEALYLMEQGYKYDIRKSYAIIGYENDKRKGIVLAKSTPAKKLGIKTAEPIYMAKRKCKILKVYEPHFNYYYKKSKEMMNLIKTYSPDVEIASVDECYLDYTKIENMQGDYMEFAKRLQQEILDKLGFTVNIGVANNKLCAKMASDLIKPYKINTIFDNEIEKMQCLPVEELYGIGKKTSPKLRKIGINTIKDLAVYDENKLKIHFKDQAIYMINIAKGIDNSKVISEEIAPKGISHSLTLPNDTKNIDYLNKVLLNLTEQVCRQLRNEKKYTSVITVFIKTSDFKLKSHQRKLINSISDTITIYNIAKEILNEINLEKPIRLIGVRVDNLTTKKIHQLSLFEKLEEKKDIDSVLDNLQKKYGNNIINSASTKDL